MPLVQTRGAASAQGFGEFAQASGPVYIEDVFSAYLWSGNSTNRSIVNDINLSGKGGLVWIKDRNAGLNHTLFDTARGATNYLFSDSTNAQGSAGNTLTAFNSTGFNLGTNSGYVNGSGYNYVGWTFRKQPKFFDIVTYTGTGANRTVSHNLGSVPGCIIVKRTDAGGDNWKIYHRSTTATKFFNFTTAAAATDADYWNNTEPTSAVFTVGVDASVNGSGGTYVAYLFAHDAGGFGLTGTDNVISCSSYTGNGTSFLDITLGYEPQWVMIKCSSAAQADGWIMVDNMRGMDNGGNKWLIANSANQESTESARIIPTATGFKVSSNGAVNTSAATYIYIAIRRGPMKVPTTGTSVFSPVTRTGTGATATVSTVGFPPDAALITSRNKIGTPTNNMFDRLRGAKILVSTDATTAEVTDATTVTGFDLMTGVYLGDGSSGRVNYAYGSTFINWFFRRAPSFFDEVCDTGTGAGHTISHNLGVAPQLMIRKRRDSTSNWCVYPNDITQVLFLDGTNPFGTNGATYWNSTSPTSSVFSIGTNTDVNTSAGTYVTYLFATCAGVSKVGSYTGNGTTQTINCGFGAGGARFVLIKRTDASGDWYTYDTARGMTVLTDPYLWLNSTAVEVATLGSVTTVSTGFALDAAIVAAINTNAASYIFLAIA